MLSKDAVLDMKSLGDDGVNRDGVEDNSPLLKIVYLQ